MFETFTISPVGVVESTLQSLDDCPLQGHEGAPEAILRISPQYQQALKGLEKGRSVMILTWLHAANRSVLQCYPRKEVHAPVIGVFATRSPDRPNPIGYHQAVIVEVLEDGLKVHPLEVLNGTPVVDIKPVI